MQVFLLLQSQFFGWDANKWFKIVSHTNIFIYFIFKYSATLRCPFLCQCEYKYPHMVLNQIELEFQISQIKVCADVVPAPYARTPLHRSNSCFLHKKSKCVVCPSSFCLRFADFYSTLSSNFRRELIDFYAYLKLLYHWLFSVHTLYSPPAIFPGEVRPGMSAAALSRSPCWGRRFRFRVSSFCSGAPSCGLRLYRWSSLCLRVVPQLQTLLPKTLQGGLMISGDNCTLTQVMLILLLVQTTHCVELSSLKQVKSSVKFM